MNTQVVPFPLTDAAVKKQPASHGQVVSLTSLYAMEVLAETGRSSKVIGQGEPPPMPYYENGWELRPVTDEYTLPFEVQRRINILRNNRIPIKQILIAHDLTPEMKRQQRRQEWLLWRQKAVSTATAVVHALSPYMKALGVAIAAAGLGVVVAAVLIPLIVAGLGTIVVLGGLYALACGTDPIAIVVLDDERQSWISVGMWYE